jgi:hypothetical protein
MGLKVPEGRQSIQRGFLAKQGRGQYQGGKHENEIATHHSTAEGARAMQAYMGSLTSDEFDMEGTAETVTEFADFFVQSKSAGPRVSRN